MAPALILGRRPHLLINLILMAMGILGALIHIHNRMDKEGEDRVRVRDRGVDRGVDRAGNNNSSNSSSSSMDMGDRI